MKSEWVKIALGELCSVLNGYAFKSGDYSKDGYGLVRIGNVQNGYLDLQDLKFIKECNGSLKKFILSEGDILVSMTGNVGRIGVVEANHLPAVLNQRVGRIKIKTSSLDKGFLLHFLKSELFSSELMKLGRGAAQQNISSKDIESINLPLPSMSEQKRIVSILDEAFKAIDQAKANTERNLKNARELFDSYLQGVFETKGEGWMEKILDDVCEFRNGKPHEEHINDDGKYAIINSKFISSNGEKGKRTNSALSPLFIGDIAFVMSDVPNGKALAKCFLVDRNDYYTLNQRIGAIKSKVFVPEFLVYQFNRNKYLLSFNNGENQTNLRKGDILKCPIYVPSREEQQVIVRQLDDLRAETQKLEAAYQKKLSDLDELKKSILQKAFAGELTTAYLS